MLDNLKKYRIILASHSPRRRELLSGLGIRFEVNVIADIDESYPPSLPASETAEYIARKKAAAYHGMMVSADGEPVPDSLEASPHPVEILLITADTVVIVGSEVLGKPTDAAAARKMLEKLSGKTHQVVTGVCLSTREKERHFSVTTDVTFKELSAEEIDYYVDNYQPLDKAGAYGIQEWIGYIGCTGLNGSYFNVMGLPVQRIYSELTSF